MGRSEDGKSESFTSGLRKHSAREGGSKQWGRRHSAHESYDCRTLFLCHNGKMLQHRKGCMQYCIYASPTRASSRVSSQTQLPGTCTQQPYELHRYLGIA